MIRFIVGTDTGAGKTFYGRKLANNGASVIKPIETGLDSFEDISQSDAYGYSKVQGKNIEDINLYFFSEPASPHLAAEIDGTEINVDRLNDFVFLQYGKHCEKYRFDAVCPPFYVELAGGLMVPLKRDFNQLDWMRQLNESENISVDLVVGNRLGCINHALMTIALLRDANIHIDNLEVNDYGEEPDRIMLDNKRVIMESLQELS